MLQGHYRVRITGSFLNSVTLVASRRGPLVVSASADSIQLFGKSGEGQFIRNLNDLVGHVSITSRARALEYVRLSTSPVTIGALEGSGYEVIPKNRLNLQMFFGDKASYEYMLAAPMGLYGVGGSDRIRSDGMTPAVVTRQGKRYVITRWLLSGAELNIRADFIRETVSEHGRYSRELLSHRNFRSYWHIMGGQ